MYSGLYDANEKKILRDHVTEIIEDHLSNAGNKNLQTIVRLTISLFWTFLTSKWYNFHLKSISAGRPLRGARGYSSKAVGKIELILSQLKSGPKITRKRKMSNKWEMRVFSICRNVMERPHCSVLFFHSLTSLGSVLTRAPMGYSRTLPADEGGGGGAFRPFHPAICQTTGPILDPKTALDSGGLELSECVSKFYLRRHWWRHRSGQR